MKEVENGVKEPEESVTNGENGFHLGTLGRHQYKDDLDALGEKY